jgi:hypothetical protein
MLEPVAAALPIRRGRRRCMRPPLRLPERAESGLVLAGVLALLAASRWMSALGAPLATPASPAGIIDFELAGTAARAAAILASWDDAAQQAARTQTLWDTVLFVPLYVTALSAWAAWCARRLPGRRQARAGIALAWAMPVAGALDLVENAALWAQLTGGARAGWAALAAACAAPKFAIVLATLAYAFAGTGVVAARAARRAVTGRSGG